jgi:hypothetical protein
MKTHCADCCSPQSVSPESCGCCEGVEIVTPLPIYNRPGLSEINYRIGTHASFLETMTARLTGYFVEKPDADGNLKKTYPLQGLTTRDKSDPSIALLDAWASVGDVMTFYQERIANEGYLDTATERRSILELSRLVGYKPRPGVSSSVFLAYSIDDNFKEETVLPIGSKVQSIPGPDELPQAFETSEEIKARAQWNNLKPRMSQPQSSSSIGSVKSYPAIRIRRVYLKGVSTNLKINDPLLIQFGSETPEFHRVKEIEPDPLADRTLVTLEGSKTSSNSTTKSLNLFNDLALKPSIQPRGTLSLRRSIADQFKSKGSAGYSSIASFTPRLKRILRTAAENAVVADTNEIKVYHLKQKASLFGHNFPRKLSIPINGNPIKDEGAWPIIEKGKISHEEDGVIYLNASYDSIKVGSWLVIQTPKTSRLTDKRDLVAKVGAVDSSASRAKYGSVAATTKIDIEFSSPGDSPWVKISKNIEEPSIKDGDDFNVLRSTTVYAQPEELELAEEPIQIPICGGTDDPIELDGFYENLESGRWVIVSGEREIKGTSGVRFSELAMISSVTQDVSKEGEMPVRPTEKTHTFIKLAEKLAYCFKRDTVTIHGNVVKATHGESRHEVLGGGNGAQTFQSFELKQFPLTHVSANNPTGIDSSLKVLVNDIEWHEASSLAELEAGDRNFITKTDNEDKTKITFGNGDKGSRLPTGSENIRAMYRNGIGKDGNVNADQISMLSTKPLGVKEVINPLPASGGANRETRDQARKNVPLAIKALERLVSVQDYQDFSRVYAGIGKAHAVEISDGRQQLVHVTIAGAEDIPIEESSDLFRNLRTALHDFGDPQQAIQLAVRELVFIVIEAAVAILPDYQWESVEPSLREKLLDAFSFERREIGQSVMLSEVIKVMQSVRGIAYVDVNAFGGVPEKRALNQQDIKILKEEHNSAKGNENFLLPYQRQILSPDEITNTVAEFLYKPKSEVLLTSFRKPIAQHLAVQTAAVVDASSSENKHIQPAQLAFITPEVPSTLVLNQIERLS